MSKLKNVIVNLWSCFKQGFQGDFSEFRQKNLDQTVLAFLLKKYIFFNFLTIFGLSGLNLIFEKRLEAEKNLKKIESGTIHG